MSSSAFKTSNENLGPAPAAGPPSHPSLFRAPREVAGAHGPPPAAAASRNLPGHPQERAGRHRAPAAARPWPPTRVSPRGDSPNCSVVHRAILLAACLLILLAGAGPAGGAEVWIDVTKAAGKKIGVHIPPFADREEPEETELRQVLEHDLRMSGYFRFVPLEESQRRLLAAERGTAQVNHAVWASGGAELLLRVDLTREKGKLALTAALHDLGGQSRLLAWEEREAPSEGVRLVHQLADAVVRTLTGEPSLALSRFAATWSQGAGPKRVIVMDYDGRNFRPVSPEGVLSLYPAWFPDGTRICYVTYRQGRPEIVVHNLKTGQVRSLAHESFKARITLFCCFHV